MYKLILTYNKVYFICFTFKKYLKKVIEIYPYSYLDLAAIEHESDRLCYNFMNSTFNLQEQRR